MRTSLDETWRLGLDVLVRQLPVGVFLTDADGNPLYLSDRCREITEAVEGEVGSAWLGRLHDDDHDRVAVAWTACLQGQPFQDSYRILHAGGSTRWVTAQAEAVVNADGEVQAIVGTVEDITDLRELTRTWGDRQLMFDAVLANSSDLVIVVDQHARLTFVSEAARRILGYDPRAWMGRDVFELLHPDDIGVTAEALVSSVESGPGVKDPLVVRVRHADGDWRTVEIVANNLVGVEHVGGLVVTARDISERLAAEATVHQARDRFEQAFDRAPIGMALVANDGSLLRVNEAFAAMIGRPRHQLIGRNLLDLALPDDRELALERALAVLRADDPTPVEVRFERFDGSTAWVRVTSTVIRDDDHRPLHTITHVEDVTEQRTLRRRLEQAATHDPLTGLLNRTGFAAGFTQVTDQGAEPGALLLIDIDRFKAVNDALGHAAGDQLLLAITERLHVAARDGDLVARLGGDEFALYAAAVPDAAAAVSLGDRIRKALAAPFALDRGTARVSGSIGIAMLDGAIDLNRALAAADGASYAAKRDGGDRIEFTWCTAPIAPGART